MNCSVERSAADYTLRASIVLNVSGTSTGHEVQNRKDYTRAESAVVLDLWPRLIWSLSSRVRQSLNIEMTLFAGNHPVALLHFQANQPRPTILLSQLEFQPGGLVIAGNPPPDPNQPLAP